MSQDEVSNDIVAEDGGVALVDDGSGALTEREEQETDKAISNAKKVRKVIKKTRKAAKKGDEKAKAALSALDAIEAVSKDLEGVSTMEDDIVTDFLSTGHLGLNYIVSGKWIDGGIPRRKLIEVYGPSGSSKTTMGYVCCASVQLIGGIAAVIDVEGGRSTDFMQTLGIDPRLCVNLIPKDKDGDDCYSIEKSFLKIQEFVKSVRKKGFDGPIFILFDSVAACPSDKEWAALKKGENIKEDQGNRAKLIGMYQRTMNTYLRSSDTTLMIINQIREKVGVMFGPKETTTSGKSIEFYSDCRLDVRRRKTIMRSSFKSKSESDDDWKKSARSRKLGGFFNISCEKSRQTSPFRLVPDVELYFDLGIAPLSGIFDLLLSDELIMKSGGAYYIRTDPESRSESALRPLEGASKFMRKDVEEGNWIYENFDLFGASSEEEIHDFVKRCRLAHEFSLGLRNALRDNKASLVDGDDDDEEKRPAALQKLSGKFKKSKAKPLPMDETGDDDDDEFDD